ncbi:hypothetical protein SDC9_100950 [bioreactor metagenome]|uniref:Uncharacterized protein n=1 Tax=bioreactor metagenome TaxID=1076179 RepID=A0A645AMM9_9ZZZZ
MQKKTKKQGVCAGIRFPRRRLLRGFYQPRFRFSEMVLDILPPSDGNRPGLLFKGGFQPLDHDVKRKRCNYLQRITGGGLQYELEI